MAKTGKDIEPFMYFHPGEILSEKMEEMEIDDVKFAEISGLQVNEVKHLKSGKFDITDQNAAALEKATGIPVSFWTKAQENYNFYLLQRLVNTLTRSLKSSSDLKSKKDKIQKTVKKISKISEVI